MTTETNEQVHSWAQTVGVIVSTVIASAGFLISLDSLTNANEEQLRQRLEANWQSYLEDQNSYFEYDTQLRSNIVNPREEFKNELVVSNLLSRLEGIYSSSENEFWRERVRRELRYYGTAICRWPIVEDRVVAAASSDFAAEIERYKRDSCVAG